MILILFAAYAANSARLFFSLKPAGNSGGLSIQETKIAITQNTISAGMVSTEQTPEATV